MEQIQIAGIKLSQDFEVYQDTESQVLQEISPLSRVNLMVGANNSGKSRFMRLLAMQEDYEVKLHDIDLDSINQQINKASQDIKRQYLISMNGYEKELITNMNSFLPSYFSLSYDKLGELKAAYHNDLIKTQGGGVIQYRFDNILNIIPIMSSETKPDQVYIPVLRGLRFVGNTKDDLYAERTKQDYFLLGSTKDDFHIEQKTPDYFFIEDTKKDFYTENPKQDKFVKQNMSAPQIFTGLTLYERLTDMLLGEYGQRKRIQEYQEFISETLFDGKRVTLIPNRKEGVIVVKIGREKERAIHDLGDGIQTAIILSFLPFTKQKPTFFFIEEPEIHLHPGLQRKLLDFFISPACEHHHFFLSTHSNHFLDMTADYQNISVFTFRKKLANRGQGNEDEQIPIFVVEAVNSGHHSSLELLGVRNSSVFLVNATIWVEGITDRWYLRAMLNCYIQHLKELNPPENQPRLEEDTHYSFVEYGGSNITHWSFLDGEEHPIEVDRLCSRAMVIVDKDGQSKQPRKEKLREKLADRLIILAGREIENTLPPEVIAAVVKDYETKKNTERKLPNFKYSDYEDQYLGTYIQETLLGGKALRKGGYAKNKDAKKPSTLKDKLVFCKKALEIMKTISYSQLPVPTQKLIKDIYKFIIEQNS